MFGKLIAGAVKGVIQTAEIAGAVTKDVAKSPIRIFGGDGVICQEGERLFEDTRQKIQEIENED